MLGKRSAEHIHRNPAGRPVVRGYGVVGWHGRVKSKNPMSRASAGRPGWPRHEIEALLLQHRDSGLSLLAFAKQHRLWLFVGHPDAGWCSAVFYSPIASCRRRGINPQAYLTDVLGRLPRMDITQNDPLFPDHWKQQAPAQGRGPLSPISQTSCHPDAPPEARAMHLPYRLPNKEMNPPDNACIGRESPRSSHGPTQPDWLANSTVGPT